LFLQPFVDSETVPGEDVIAASWSLGYHQRALLDDGGDDDRRTSQSLIEAENEYVAPLFRILVYTGQVFV
jgi:hypothetical protein